MIILSLLLACDTQTIATDTGAVGNDSGTNDSAADTDTDTDADTDTDTDTDTADTGATDTGDTGDTVDTDPSDDVSTADLVGNVYDFNIADATISPSGIGSVLSGQITQDILLEVEAADMSTIDFLAGLSAPSDPSTQDYCAMTNDILGANFAGNPTFSVGPTELALAAGGTTITLTDVYLSGTFKADLSQITGGRLAALIDSRPIEVAAGLNEGDVCSYGTMLGFTCEACPDGEDFCIAIEATKVKADLVKGLDLLEIAGNNCDGCESGPPAVDAVCY